MQELHVVAVSKDGRHVLLASGTGTPARAEFHVAMDDRLKAAIRGDLPRLGEQSAPQSAVTPKEIQARLRAGESVEQIAAAAGVPAARVERFAGPVLSERERVVAGARAAVLARPRRGLSALPLGDAVAEHLQEMSGYQPDTTVWSARREESGRWLVQVSFLSRGKQRTAGWRWDPATREVVAVDPWSAAMAHADAPVGSGEPTPAEAARRSIVAAPIAGRSIAAAPPPVPDVAPSRTAGSRRAPGTPARAAASSRAGSSTRAAASPRAAAPSRAAAAARSAASARTASTRNASTQATPTRAAAPIRAAGPRPAAAAGVTRPPSPAAAVTSPVEVAAAAATPTRAASESAKRRPQGRPAAPSVAVRTGTTPAAAADTPGSGSSAMAGTVPVREEPAGTAPAAGSDPVRGAGAGPGAAATRGAPGPTPGPSGPPTLSVVPAHRSAPADADTHDATDGTDVADDREAAEAPDVTEKVPAPVTPRPAARRAAGGRASVPVWADVLLGTAPVRPTSRDEQEPSRD